MEGDPISIEEELENIASVLRKLIMADDEPLDRTSKVDGGVSNASSSSSFGTRRIFDEEKSDESNASSADKLDWRPSFDSVESLKAASLRDFNLRQLFLEGKDAAASTSHMALRRLLEDCDKAAPESLSDCCIDRLFKDDPELKESLSNLGIRCLFREEKPTAASLSDFGIRQLFQQIEDAAAATSAATITNPPDDKANRRILVARRRLTRAAQDVSKAIANFDKLGMAATVAKSSGGDAAVATATTSTGGDVAVATAAKSTCVAAAKRKILIAKRRLTRTGPVLVSKAVRGDETDEAEESAARSGPLQDRWKSEDREKAAEQKMEKNESDDDESDAENSAVAAKDAGTWFVLDWLLGGDKKKDGAKSDDEGGVVASKSFGTRLIGQDWRDWPMRENEGKDGAENDEVVVTDDDESGALEKNDTEEESGLWQFLGFLIRALLTFIFVMAVMVHIGRETTTGDETNLTWFWVDEDDVTWP